MATLRLESAPSGELAQAKAPVTPASAGQVSGSSDIAKAVTLLGRVESIRAEIDDAMADMKVFSNHEPDAVMAAVSAHSARLVEIVVLISRVEHMRREWRPVREECERVIGELKNQFGIASRLHAMREFDWNASGRGQT